MGGLGGSFNGMSGENGFGEPEGSELGDSLC